MMIMKKYMMKKNNDELNINVDDLNDDYLENK